MSLLVALVVVAGALAVVGVVLVLVLLQVPRQPVPGTLRAGESGTPGPERAAVNRSTWMLGGGGGL